MCKRTAQVQENVVDFVCAREVNVAASTFNFLTLFIQFSIGRFVHFSFDTHFSSFFVSLTFIFLLWVFIAIFFCLLCVSFRNSLSRSTWNTSSDETRFESHLCSSILCDSFVISFDRSFSLASLPSMFFLLIPFATNCLHDSPSFVHRWPCSFNVSHHSILTTAWK